MPLLEEVVLPGRDRLGVALVVDQVELRGCAPRRRRFGGASGFERALRAVSAMSVFRSSSGVSSRSALRWSWGSMRSRCRRRAADRRAHRDRAGIQTSRVSVPAAARSTARSACISSTDFRPFSGTRLYDRPTRCTDMLAAFESRARTAVSSSWVDSGSGRSAARRSRAVTDRVSAHHAPPSARRSSSARKIAWPARRVGSGRFRLAVELLEQAADVMGQIVQLAARTRARRRARKSC